MHSQLAFPAFGGSGEQQSRSTWELNEDTDPNPHGNNMKKPDLTGLEVAQPSILESPHAESKA